MFLQNTRVGSHEFLFIHASGSLSHSLKAAEGSVSVCGFIELEEPYLKTTQWIPRALAAHFNLTLL